MTQKRYFVTGTGTGVGKTFVTCALANLAGARGLEVVAHKPIETGCPMVNGYRHGADQSLLNEASSKLLDLMDDDEVEFGTYQLELAEAPSVAARAEHRQIDLNRIESVLERASRIPSFGAVPSRPFDLLLVEGAGGWRVPISDEHDMRELARLVGGQVIVVGLAGLGTINHSLLTLEAVERDGFDVAALVLSNRPDDDPLFVQRNVAELRKRWSGRVLLIGDLEQLLSFCVERSQPLER